MFDFFERKHNNCDHFREVKKHLNSDQYETTIQNYVLNNMRLKNKSTIDCNFFDAYRWCANSILMEIHLLISVFSHSLLTFFSSGCLRISFKVQFFEISAGSCRSRRACVILMYGKFTDSQIWLHY